MPVQQTLQQYQGPNKYNCAQAVLAGFQELCPIPVETIESYRTMGGGRAEQGLCGALYAARQLLGNDPATREQLTDQFKQVAGSLRCREIKASKSLSCRDCVKTAAELLHTLAEPENLAAPEK